MRHGISIIRFVSALFLLVTVSCKNNLIEMKENILDRASDTTVPVLVLETPIEDSIYDQKITISGSISDDGVEMPAISYSLSDVLGVEAIEGTIDVTEEVSGSGSTGTFLFELSTAQFDTDIILTLDAVDWNGNSAETISVKLNYPGSTLPSLTVIPGNSEITINWDAIAEAEDYTIYYNTEGTPFAESLAGTISLTAAELVTASPITLNSSEHGVKNGILCQIRVTASDSEGNTWSSPLMDTVPLSSFSLIPKTETYEDRIFLTWKSVKVPAQKSVTYQVWRSSNGDEGSYSLLSDELLIDSEFTDTSAAGGTVYYYKVSVEENSNITSLPIAAQCPEMYTELSAEINRFFNGELYGRVEISGNTAYAIRSVHHTNPSSPYWVDIELIAMDISNLSNITVLSRDECDLEDVKKSTSSVYWKDLTISDERAYVALQYTNTSSQIVYKIYSFDITTPTNIQLKPSETIDPPAASPFDDIYCVSADSSRDVLYMGIRDGTDAYLGSADISTATSPGAINMSTAVAGIPKDVGYSGNYAYLISTQPDSSNPTIHAKLTPYDCTVRTAPSKGTSVNLTDSSNYEEALGISADQYDDFDYITALDIDTASGIMVIVSQPDVTDSHYYHGGVWVYDISTPGTPDFQGGIDVGIPLTDVEIKDSFAYCSTKNGKVKVLGISTPSNIYERVEYDTTGDSPGIGLNDEGIIVADDSAGITTIKTGDTESLTVVDTESPSQSYGSYLKGDRLYLAQRFGVSAYQITSGGMMSQLNYQSMYSEDVVVLGNHAFYATGSNTSGEIAVIGLSGNGDVSASPQYYSGVDNTTSLDYWGDYLYAGEGGAGVEIFDISDPENLVSVGLIPVNRSAEFVLARDDYLYIADNWYGLLCYNITDPLDPIYIGDFYNRNSDAAERSATNISATKDHIVFSADLATYILPARPQSDWVEANASSSGISAGSLTPTELGSALAAVNLYNSGLLAEGSILYFTKSFTVYMYSLEKADSPRMIYISPYGLISGNNETIELFGNYIVVHDHNTLYSLQINQ